jgi:site-specific DNA recombinase
MKVIGYIRVSTEEQAVNGQSLDAQRAKLEAYAALYDLELVDIIVDAGVSAKSLEPARPAGCLAKLRRGEADGLVIAKLDRLTRSVGDWQALIDGYFGDKAGKQLFSVADSIDTRTAAGRLVLNVLLLSVPQWERETIAERTRDALQHKIGKGERCGKVRFGFALADDGKTVGARRRGARSHPLDAGTAGGWPDAAGHRGRVEPAGNSDEGRQAVEAHDCQAGFWQEPHKAAVRPLAAILRGTAPGSA